MSTFNPKQWVLVGDTNICEHTVSELKFLQENSIDLKGMIPCNDEKYKDHEACKMIPAFPAFCNTETQLCVSGLRDSWELFHDLQKISDEKK